jgi:fumarate reductase flavoprotein subunit
MQVLNNSETPIEGLYAAGEVVGGIMGDLYVGGQTYNWAMTSGVQAGKVVSEKLGK